MSRVIRTPRGGIIPPKSVPQYSSEEVEAWIETHPSHSYELKKAWRDQCKRAALAEGLAAKLAKAQRQVSIVRLFNQGMSQQDIASTIGVSSPAVSQALQRLGFVRQGAGPGSKYARDVDAIFDGREPFAGFDDSAEETKTSERGPLDSSQIAKLMENDPE